MSTPRPPAPRGGGLTGRAALLGLVLCGLALTMAYPLREYLSQRALIADQEQSVALLRSQVHTLQGQRSQLDDPAFVEQQARSRLHFVRPGETTYLLIKPSSQEPRDTTPAPAGTPTPTTPWYSQLLDSAQRAGR